MATPNDGFYLYQLRMFKEMGVLASLFIDPRNPDDFIAGFIEAVNQRQVMMRSVSPFGRFDGFIVSRLADIDLIMGEDDYSVRLSRLIKARGEQPKDAMSVEEGEDLIHALCRQAIEDDAVVTLWLHDDIEHVGRVIELNDMRVTIGELDYFGRDPRPATFTLREIEMASLGSEDDKLYQLLSDQPIVQSGDSLPMEGGPIRMSRILYGNGINDDTAAIQELIVSGKGELRLPMPEKFYLISRPLELPSNFSLILPRFAEIRLMDGASCPILKNKMKPDHADRLKSDFSATARHIWSYIDDYSPDAPCKNIEVRGGIWNLNNMNQAPNPIQSSAEKWVRGFTGSGLLFYHVQNLRLSDMTIKDPTTFGIELDTVSYFTIENIDFDYNRGNPMALNMDGVHLDGNCHFGVIRNLKGACYDDMVALNAHEGSRGPITNIQIDGLFAENCHSAVRLLTVFDAIENIHISNIYGTYYQYAVGLTKGYRGEPTGYMDSIEMDHLFISKASREGIYPFPNSYRFPLIYIDNDVRIKNLSIRALHRKERTLPLDTLLIDQGASVDRLLIRDATTENHTGEPMAFIRNKGTVSFLSLTDCFTNGDQPLADEGTIKEQCIR